MSLITTAFEDSDGITVITHNNILSVDYADVINSPFGAPNSTFTGYAANGKWYNNGVLGTAADSMANTADWNTESLDEASSTRGKVNPFPDRIFTINTNNEIVIVDADNLRMWMRFNKSGTVFQNVFDAQFVNGILFCVSATRLIIVDFTYDHFSYVEGTASSYKYVELIRNRNTTVAVLSDANTPPNLVSGPSDVILGTNILCLDTNYIGNIAKAAIGQESGFCGIQSGVTSLDNRKFASVVKHESVVSFSNTTVALSSTSSDFLLTASVNFITTHKVRVGDNLVFTTPGAESFYLKVLLDDTALVLQSVDGSVTTSTFNGQSCNFKIKRPVPAISVVDNGDLIVSTPNRIYEITSDWDVATVSINLFTQNSIDTSSDLLNQTSNIGSATDGILTVINQDKKLFQLSNSSLTLVHTHGSSITNLVIDPESTHVFFSDSTHLNELDLNTFSIVSSTTAACQTLVAYRNPNGPPDKAVS